ncbi:MAG: right-handed parallel beta-helix repeat-containing protein, partial [Candidatus Sericytochromatia bacterium]
MCPICDEELSSPLPESCPKCGKRNFSHDITINPAMHSVPKEIEKIYLKWIGRSRKLFSVKKQYDSIYDEVLMLRAEVEELEDTDLSDLIQLYCGITGKDDFVSLKNKEIIVHPEFEPQVDYELDIEEDPQEVPEDEKPVIVVGKSLKYEIRTISDAIKKAEDGTRILVKAGKYREDIIVDKDVEIIADAKPSEVIIENRLKNCFIFKNPKALLRGFTINSKSVARGKTFFAIDIQSGEPIIENCTISSDSVACIAIHGESSNPLIRKCKIQKGKQHGIYIFDKAKGRVEGCNISDNEKMGIVISTDA